MDERIKRLEESLQHLTNKFSDLEFKFLELGKAFKALDGKTEKKKKVQGISVPAWTAYEKAFWNRYGFMPVRNAKVNAQCMEIVKRLGDEARPVIDFYLTLNDPQYVRLNHPIGLLAMSAESVHAMWKRGRMTTTTEARAMENASTNMNASQKWLEKKHGNR